MGVASIPAFRLRFPVADVRHWADRYDYADDAEVETIGRAARKQGYYSRDEFLRVTLWKTERSKSRCARNSAAAVREITWVALHATGERLRIGSLTLLEGVQTPTASVLLHLAHEEPYPILDYRAGRRRRARQPRFGEETGRRAMPLIFGTRSRGPSRSAR